MTLGGPVCDLIWLVMVPPRVLPLSPRPDAASLGFADASPELGGSEGGVTPGDARVTPGVAVQAAELRPQVMPC